MSQPKPKAEIIVPPNTLKEKVGSGSGKVSFDPATLKRAEQAVANLKSEFSDWLAEDVQALIEALVNFNAARNAETAGVLFRAAHDLKGQAGTFEYPLIARIAGSLAKLMDGLKSWDEAPKPLVAAHVEAIQAIHRDKIKDMSDLTALTLTEELEGRVVKTLENANAA